MWDIFMHLLLNNNQKKKKKEQPVLPASDFKQAEEPFILYLGDWKGISNDGKWKRLPSRGD